MTVEYRIVITRTDTDDQGFLDIDATVDATVKNEAALASILNSLAQNIWDKQPQPDYIEPTTHLVPKEWFETALMNEQRVALLNKRIDDIYNHENPVVRAAAHYLNSGMLEWKEKLDHIKPAETSDEKIYVVVIKAAYTGELQPDSVWSSRDAAAARCSDLQKAGHAETWGIRVNPKTGLIDVGDYRQRTDFMNKKFPERMNKPPAKAVWPSLMETGKKYQVELQGHAYIDNEGKPRLEINDGDVIIDFLALAAATYIQEIPTNEQ